LNSHAEQPAIGPTTRTIRVNGIMLSYHEWARQTETGKAPLVIAHATGFHGRCYGAIAERFPDRRVLSLDLRGHGQSEGQLIDDWRVLSDDVNAVLDQLGIEGAIGVGHSMGAHTLLQCASDRPKAFARLVLFDPVILAPEYYAADSLPLETGEPHPAIRRKRDFASAEAMMERFGPREPYSLFDARVFEDYCRYGLLPSQNGGFELACAPEMEASVYDSSRSNRGIIETAKALPVPTLIVRAKQSDIRDFKGSPTWPLLASTMPLGEDLPRPDRTHFHPFEDPADAADIIARFANR